MILEEARSAPSQILCARPALTFATNVREKVFHIPVLFFTKAI